MVSLVVVLDMWFNVEEVVDSIYWYILVLFVMTWPKWLSHYLYFFSFLFLFSSHLDLLQRRNMGKYHII